MIFNVSVLQLVKEALDMLYDISCVSVRISDVYFPVLLNKIDFDLRSYNSIFNKIVRQAKFALLCLIIK